MTTPQNHDYNRGRQTRQPEANNGRKGREADGHLNGQDEKKSSARALRNDPRGRKRRTKGSTSLDASGEQGMGGPIPGEASVSGDKTVGPRGGQDPQPKGSNPTGGGTDRIVTVNVGGHHWRFVCGSGDEPEMVRLIWEIAERDGTCLDWLAAAMVGNELVNASGLDSDAWKD